MFVRESTFRWISAILITSVGVPLGGGEVPSRFLWINPRTSRKDGPVCAWEVVTALVQIQVTVLLIDVNGLFYASAKPVRLAVQDFGLSRVHGMFTAFEVVTYRP